MTSNESPKRTDREVDETVRENPNQAALEGDRQADAGTARSDADASRIIPDAELRGALYAVAIALTSLLAALDLIDRELVPPVADAAGSLLVAGALVIAHLNRPKRPH